MSTARSSGNAGPPTRHADQGHASCLCPANVYCTMFHSSTSVNAAGLRMKMVKCHCLPANRNTICNIRAVFSLHAAAGYLSIIVFSPVAKYNDLFKNINIGTGTAHLSIVSYWRNTDSKKMFCYRKIT